MNIGAAIAAFGTSDEEKALLSDLQSIAAPFIGSVISHKLSLFDVADTLRGAKVAPPWMVKLAKIVDLSLSKLPSTDAGVAVVNTLLPGRWETVKKLAARFAPVCNLNAIVDPNDDETVFRALKELAERIVESDKSLQPAAICICPNCKWTWVQLPTSL